MVADSEMIETRYHYFFIHNVLGDFFEDTLEYFADYLYPRFEYTVVGTYHKAVEYINKQAEYGRETDIPILPALILNPSGDFNLADANTGAKQLWRFPNMAPLMVKRLFEPIYQDKNVIIHAGFTRLKGEFELIIIPNSFYEYADLKLFLIQMFGGQERYIYPRWFNSFIIIPEEVLNYRYTNDYTGTDYTIDVDEAGAISKLVKTTNRTERVFPCKIKPIYRMMGMSDASEKYGSTDNIAEWKLSVTIEYELEIPSYIVLETDYLAENAEFNMDSGSAYSTNPDFNSAPADQVIGGATRDSGLDEQSNSEYEPAPDGTIGPNKDLRFKTRYFHILTQSEIDSTADIVITMPESVQDQKLLVIQSKSGKLNYGAHYILIDNGETLILKKDNLQLLDVGDMLELYIYEEV